jgi:hypothetical protein
MPRFKVKDLMIDIVSIKEDAQKLYPRTCLRYFTPLPTCLNYKTCRWAISDITCVPGVTWINCGNRTVWAEQQFEVCPGNSGMPIELDPQILYAMDPRELAMVRELLLKEVAKVKEIEQRVSAEMAPQTLEEVELLESKIQEAAAELEMFRERFAKRPTE